MFVIQPVGEVVGRSGVGSGGWVGGEWSPSGVRCHLQLGV